MKIAFLGLGKMGRPMVRHLVAAGHEVAVWNRTLQRAEELKSLGVRVAMSPASAARGAEAAMTMLFDDAAVEEVVLGSGELLASLAPGALHIVHSTISVALSERLAQEHARRNVDYVAAPVFGRPNVAEAGQLWVVAAGAEKAVARAHPLLAAFSRGISVVGAEPAQAHAVKLGGNFLISVMLYGLSEAFVFAEGQGIDAAGFFDAINNALFQSPFMAAYSKIMLTPPKEAGASVALGEKDTRLLREAAAGRGMKVGLAESLAKIYAEARAAGMEDQDWAVGQYRMAKRRALQNQ
jgi:3-hydroxyisobutyrate dehydrogenase-like beta-hydroxyacid dehydrogenase